jgi:phosphotransferase system HPr (HPr) family protein
MVEVIATVRNTMGIHCRPSAIIVKATQDFDGDLEVVSPDGRCNPRSILELIAMGLSEGTTVMIRVSGPEEEKVAPRFVELFERHFDFPPDPNSISPLRNPPPSGAS